MSIALLIIAHDNIGQSMLDAASNMLGMCPLNTRVISVSREQKIDDTLQYARQACQELKNQEGILILTDIYGSTPCNIARKLMQEHLSQRIITGINLQMLIRIMNYPHLSLTQLAEKAHDGAREGIFIIDEK